MLVSRKACLHLRCHVDHSSSLHAGLPEPSEDMVTTLLLLFLFLLLRLLLLLLLLLFLLLRLLLLLLQVPHGAGGTRGLPPGEQLLLVEHCPHHGGRLLRQRPLLPHHHGRVGRAGPTPLTAGKGTASHQPTIVRHHGFVAMHCKDPKFLPSLWLS